MLANLALRAQLTTKKIARQAVFGTLGAIFALVGGGFFTAALWIALARGLGPIGASVLIGMVFFLTGLALIVWGNRAPRVVPREQVNRMTDPHQASPRPATRLTGASIAEAFLIGLTAARAMGGRRG